MPNLFSQALNIAPVTGGMMSTAVNAVNSYMGGSVTPARKSEFLGKLDPAMKFDLGLAGIDIIGSGIMGIQAAKAKAPTVFRVPTPRLETPKIIDGTSAEESLIKENLGIQTNTILNNAMETGQDINTVGPGIFANANRIMRESASAITKERAATINNQNIAITETENKNKMLEADNQRDYQTRKADAYSRDALARGQQMSQAVSNVGAIGSRLINDFMLTNIIKKGNEADFSSANTSGVVNAVRSLLK